MSNIFWPSWVSAIVRTQAVRAIELGYLKVGGGSGEPDGYL